MMNSPILLFSGGVDSVLCLHSLVEQNISPTLFHFFTKRMNKSQERQIKSLAHKISPESPYYAFETVTAGFRAGMEKKFPYYYVRWRLHGKRKYMYPLLYGSPIILGYNRWMYQLGRNYVPHRCNQRSLIDFCRMYNLPFIFPLATKKRKEIDDLFNGLPDDIQVETLSSTRYYDFGGKSIKR